MKVRTASPTGSTGVEKYEQICCITTDASPPSSDTVHQRTSTSTTTQTEEPSEEQNGFCLVSVAEIQRAATFVALSSLVLVLVATYVTPFMQAVYKYRPHTKVSSEEELRSATDVSTLAIEAYMSGRLACTDNNAPLACPLPDNEAGTHAVPELAPITWACHAMIAVLVLWLVVPRLLVSRHHQQLVVTAHTTFTILALLLSVSVDLLFVFRNEAIGKALMNIAGWEDRSPVTLSGGGAAYLTLAVVALLMLCGQTVLYHHRGTDKVPLLLQWQRFLH